MIAVIKTGGKQYKVKPSDIITVEKIADAEDNKDLVFSEVLLVNDETKTRLGSPIIKGAKVIAKVLTSAARSRKIKAMKTKRKVRYLRRLGHRQFYTKLEIKEIKL